MQVIVGGQAEFNSLVYGDMHPGTMRFLQNQVSQGFSNTLTDVGRNMLSSVGSLFEKFNGENALRLAKAARRKVTGLFQQDIVKPLWSLEEIQQAALTMQRWVMAHPGIRKLYHDQRCDGFSDTYLDMQPDVFGEKHYDYRRVMDGLATEDQDGTLNITYYYDDVPDDDPELSLHDVVDIRNTWDMIERYLKHTDDDPTSIYGDKL